MAEMTAPRRRMIEDMQVRNLSPVTQRCYVHAVAKFARHFNRSPDRLRLEEIRAHRTAGPLPQEEFCPPTYFPARESPLSRDFLFVCSGH